MTARGIVESFEVEPDRTLIYLRGRPDYHVIAAAKTVDIQIGDEIEFTPEGVNFGWLVGRGTDPP